MAENNIDVLRRLVESFGDLPALLPFVAPDDELIPLRAATEGRWQDFGSREKALDAVGLRE